MDQMIILEQGKMSKKDFETGQCYVMYVEYRDNKGDFLTPRKGKFRPVVLLKDPIDNTIYACQTTTQIHKPRYLTNGILLQNKEAAGMKKETIVRLEFHCRYLIDDPEGMVGPIGKLSDTDIDNMLEKLIEIRTQEIRKEQDLEL